VAESQTERGRMRLTGLTKWDAKVPWKSEYRNDFEAMKKHLAEKTKPGLPYNAMTIMQELNINNLFDMNGRDKKCLQQVIKYLVINENWRMCRPAYYFCIDEGYSNTSLYDFLDVMIPPGFPFSLVSAARNIKGLTGEDVKTDTLRKTVGRLRKKGRFVKVDHRRFKRTHIGY